MASFHSKPNPVNISIILNLIKYDCIVLFQIFRRSKPMLKHAIELYEEFMTTELNTIFELSNNFSDIVRTHRKHFRQFVNNAEQQIFGIDKISKVSNGQQQQQQQQPPQEQAKQPDQQLFHDGMNDNGIYVIFISLQEWLMQGSKGQQFYFMIDIDSFNYTKQMQFQITNPCNGYQKSINEPHSSGDNRPTDPMAKLARLLAIDLSSETYVAFKGDGEPIETIDNSIRNNIQRVQHFMKHKGKRLGSIDITPSKCAYLLLQRLFYGVSVSEERQTNLFQAKVMVNKRYEFAGTTQTSAISAKNTAARRALNALCEIECDIGFRRQPETLPNEFGDYIQSLILNRFAELKCVDMHSKIVVSGIVQTTNADMKTGKVIAIATGTKGIDGDSMHQNGSVVFDTHAEIVARRCLMYYLYDQLELLLNSETAKTSIFVKSACNSKAAYTLRDNIRFHLYISKGPCGDATAYGTRAGPERSKYIKYLPNRGKLRAKVEKSEGNKLLVELNELQSSSGIHSGVPLYTMTCSDKIARWNIVGVQGALLSRIIAPIYLNSIILGREYQTEDIIHTVYGRIEKSINLLPKTFHHNQPYFMMAKYQRRDTHKSAPNDSINWICGQQRYEKIESKTGQAKTENDTCIVSRISKNAFFHRFIRLMRNLPDFANTNGYAYNKERKLYADEKQKATDFQIAKEVCIAAFEKEKLGNWKFATKPDEIDQFFADVE